MSLVLDLDAISPKSQLVKLGDKEFDVSIVPFNVSLRFYDCMPILEKMENLKPLSEDEYKKILSIIYDIFKVSDPELTFEWICNKLNVDRFNKLLPLILDNMFGEDAKKNKETAKAEGATVKSS